MSENTKSRAGSKRDTSVESNKTEQIDLLRQALAWFFNDRMFAKIWTHGNAKWSARSLVTLAILMAWSEASQITEAFKKAASLSNRLYGMLAVATYQGLMRALVTYSPQLLPVVWSRLQCLMQRCGAEHFRIGIWLPLAVDGSRFTTPRTQSNEKAFSAKNYGEGQKSQVSQEMEK